MPTTIPPVHSLLHDDTALDLLSTAADPETPPSVLSLMARDFENNEALCELLALNPNTPLQDLFRLWVRNPLAALENPILVLHTLQSGRVLHQIVPHRVQHELYTALHAAKRPAEVEEHLPVKARVKWFNTTEPQTQFYYRSPEPQTPEGTRDVVRCVQRGREDDFVKRFFGYLAKDPSPAVRRDMVSKIPTHALGGYMWEAKADIRLLLAKRVSENYGGRGLAESQVLERLRDALSRDSVEAIRCCIAGGGALENPLFERLARDPSLSVRKLLAGRTTPNDTRLCTEGWTILSETSNEIARLVASNYACPFLLRLKLTEHPDLQVRKNAWSVMQFGSRRKRRLLMLRVEQLLQRPSRHPELRTLASNKTIPTLLAARFATLQDPLPRIVAANPRLPDKVRRSLLQESDQRTARTSLEHATGNEILWEALRHPSAAVRAALIRKKGVHAAHIRRLLAKDRSLDVRRFLVTHLVKGKDLDGTERKRVRPQVELVLASASPVERQGLLYMRPLRKALAIWKLRDSLNHLQPCNI